MKNNIAIICSLDGYANSLKPNKIKDFLTQKGYSVHLLNVSKITNLLNSVPNSEKFLILPLIVITSIISLINEFLIPFPLYKKYLFYYVLVTQMKLRAIILQTTLRAKKYDAVIVETSYDSYVLTKNLNNIITIYDCPTPWGFELYDSGYFTKNQFESFKKIEKNIYKCADHLCFHWETYKNFIEENLYKGDNLFVCNFGCDLKNNNELSIFNEKPRIIYVGSLAGEWINLPLLSKLSQIYPIDVYGGPMPDKNLGLNFKGYLKDKNILKKYQFGLITTTKDKLRRHGFSAKHTEYLSYGLPVFVPEWRKDNRLNSGNIYYSEDNFLRKIKEYSPKQKWTEKQQSALKLAKELTWDKTLQPLLPILTTNL